MAKSLKDELITELATPYDVRQVVEIEKRTWPSGEDMVADEEKFTIRQRIGGLIVAKHPGTGQVFGYVTVFKPKWASASALQEILEGCTDTIVGLPPHERWNLVSNHYGIPHNWHEATGNGWLYDGAVPLHDSKGKVAFGVGVTTDKDYQGLGIVDKTLSKALELAAESGAKYFMGFSRLPAYQETEAAWGELTLDEYVHLWQCDHYSERSSSLLLPHDYGFRFHWRLGAQPACTESGMVGYIGVPNAMADDQESNNAGVLVITPFTFSGLTHHPTAPYPFGGAVSAINYHKHLAQKDKGDFMGKATEDLDFSNITHKYWELGGGRMPRPTKQR